MRCRDAQYVDIAVWGEESLTQALFNGAPRHKLPICGQ